MYVRRDRNCQLVVQPAHETATDVYGNTFENWCTDAKICNVDNVITLAGCRPQDPDGLIALYEFRTVTNGLRTPNQYIDSPLIPGTTLDDAVTLEGVAILGLEEDRDLVLYNESNTQSLQLEDSTSILAGTTFS